MLQNVQCFLYLMSKLKFIKNWLSYCNKIKKQSTKNRSQMLHRGVSSYLKLGGQTVIRRNAAGWRRLLVCQKMGGQLPTPAHPLVTPMLHTIRHPKLRICSMYYLLRRQLEMLLKLILNIMMPFDTISGTCLDLS